MADNNESGAEPSSCGKRSALSNDESLGPKVETRVHVPSQELEYVRKEVLPRLAVWIQKRVLEVKRATILDLKNSEGKAQKGETSSNPSITKLESIPSKIMNNEEGKNGEEIEELHFSAIEIEEEEEEEKGGVTEAIPMSIYTTPLQEVKSAIELDLENSETKTQNGEMNSNSSMELQATKLESIPSNIINVEKENINGGTIIDEIDSYLLMVDDEELKEQEGDEMSVCYSFQQELENLMKLDSVNSEEKTQEKVMDSSSIEEVTKLESAPSKMINVEEENNGGERDEVQSTPMVDADITQEQQKEEGAVNAIPIFIYSNPAQEKEMNSNSTVEVTKTDSIPSKIVTVEEENNGGGKDEVQSTLMVDAEITQEQQKEEGAVNAIPIFIYSNPAQEKEMNSNSTVEVTVEEENNGGGKDEVTPMVDADVTQEQQKGVIDAIPISIYSNPAQKPGKMKQPATLLGESPMVFQIPQEYVQYLAAIDQVVSCHPEYPGIVFMKRLDGWTIQQKRRAKASLVDAYYLHKEVKKIFRSSKEVSDFIVYSIIREKPSQSAAKKRRLEQKPNSWEQGSAVATMSPAGEQDAASGEHSDEEKQPLTPKEQVERFLRESWENLQKLGKPSKTT